MFQLVQPQDIVHQRREPLRRVAEHAEIFPLRRFVKPAARKRPRIALNDGERRF